MPKNRADNPERNRNHNQQRLRVAAKRNRKQSKNDNQHQFKTIEHTLHRLPSVLVFTFHVVAQAGVVGHQFRQVICFDCSNNLFSVGSMAVDCRRNIDHTLPIAAVDFAETATLNQSRCSIQGNLATTRHADTHGFEIPETLTALFGITNQNLNFVAPTLQSQGFRAIESATQLSTQVLFGNPERSRFSLEANFNFALAQSVIIGNIARPGIGGKKPLEAFGSLIQHGKVLMSQLNIDISAEINQIRNKS